MTRSTSGCYPEQGVFQPCRAPDDAYSAGSEGCGSWPEHRRCRGQPGSPQRARRDCPGARPRAADRSAGPRRWSAPVTGPAIGVSGDHVAINADDQHSPPIPGRTKRRRGLLPSWLRRSAGNGDDGATEVAARPVPASPWLIETAHGPLVGQLEVGFVGPCEAHEALLHQGVAAFDRAPPIRRTVRTTGPVGSIERSIFRRQTIVPPPRRVEERPQQGWRTRSGPSTGRC